MPNSQTLRPAAKECNITLHTSFRCRYRFLQAIEQDQATDLTGIAELDETFFRESFKGQKMNLPRPARKRGNDRKTACQQIPVMVARDRDKHTVDAVLKNESADELCHHLNKRIDIEAVICADASLAHEKLAKKLGFIFKELVSSSGKKVLDGVFHGVATKYLSHYLGWRRALTESKSLTADRLTSKILGFMHVQPL